MTEETFNKACDIMQDRNKHQWNAEDAQRILDMGLEHVDIREVLRLSDNLRTDIYQYIVARLKKYIDDCKACVEICNEQLKEL